MQILFKDSPKRLDQLINKALKDIDLYGKDHEVALTFKGDFVLEDYEHLEDLELHNEELVFKPKLIELLIMLYTIKTNTRIGSVIRAYRKVKGLSQKALSEAIEVHIRSVESWENGIRTPNAKDLFKMIRCLEIDIEYVEKALIE